jgi:glycosyltransferase involved in cell wall biosynthesis
VRILVAVQGGAGAKVTGPEIRGWALAQALAGDHDVTVAVHDPPGRHRDGLRLIPNRRIEVVREARRHDAVVAPVVPPFLFAALRGTSTITVADQYDPIWLELSIFKELPHIARVIRAQRMIREAQVRYADVIAVAGEGQRELLMRELDAAHASRIDHARVVTVPFGVPEPPPPATSRPVRDAFPGIGADDPVILWWGKVWKWFDASTAIRAFQRVVAHRPDARLVISAGKAPKAKFDQSERTSDARELARSLELLDRNVFFLDEWTPYDCRHEYLQDADVGLTLHADTAEAPFAARARYMDYLWSGLPCVLATGDEIAARFGASGFATLVAPGDVDGTAASLLALIDDPTRRLAARRAGLELAESYRWSAVVRPLAAAMEECQAARRRRSSRDLARTVGRYYARRTIDHLATARAQLASPRAR